MNNGLAWKGAPMQITKPLDVTEQQIAQLELHTFLNTLNILMGELQLLELELPEPAGLPETMDRCGRILARVREGRLGDESSTEASTLREIFEMEFGVAVGHLKDPTAQAAARENAGNILSILKVLQARLAEYRKRLETGDTWVPQNIRTLTGNFVNFFAALEKNSKGRYRILYNIASQEPTDYLVNFRIESVDGEVLCMPPVLQDVFRDLIANARKYTPPGGEITAGLVDTGTELRMVVEDTGCGIPADEIPRVTEFGYRASNVQSKATRGGGFGLTKAYYTTTRLGGTMWIRSTLGVGTRITIHVPRPNQPVNGSATASAAAPLATQKA